MINKIKLKFGSAASQPPLEITTTPITIFVGPNNSGKSKLLMEIKKFCDVGIRDHKNLILEQLEFSSLPNPEEEIERHTLKFDANNALDPNYIIFGSGSQNKKVMKRDLLTYLSGGPPHIQSYCTFYVSFNTIILNGDNRIRLVQDQVGGNLQDSPQNSSSMLFRDNVKRKEVRRIIYDAFQKYFVIDPTNLGQLKIRLSAEEPTSEIQERGIHEDAINFHSKALAISLASDGVKAFTGIITTVIAGDPKIILIDEPEAFLHPSLATILGKEISNSLNGSFKNLLVSTHSSNFLMGCIQSGTPINIVRLTYSNDRATARILPSEKVLKLMRHPLLRSTGVLNGLFYECVVVTEADADRAFYQEINERLLAFSPTKGIPNCLFINAQNKQTIHEIMKPLREMGIPCAAIVDVDVVKDGGVVWTNLLKSAFVPDMTITSTGVLRGHVKAKFDTKLPLNFKTQGGVDLLDAPDREACNNLFDQIEEYGIFTVRKGELESWLKSLSVTAGHSPNWLIEVFEKLGEDPATLTYVKPSDGDVWDFIAKIKTWFVSPLRKGIPE